MKYSCGMFLAFDVSERDPLYSRILEICNEKPVSYKLKFSADEMRNARWFSVVSHTRKVNLVRENNTFSFEEPLGNGRFCHVIKTEKPFYVSAPLKITARQHFFSSDMLPDSLFCTERAKQCLSRFADAVSFEPVLRASTERPVGNLYFLRFRETIPADAIDLSESSRTFICPTCQKQTFMPPNVLRIKEQHLENVGDFFMTEKIFSEGGWDHNICIVSKRVYQLIKDEHLHRGVEFMPVQMF